MWGTKQAKIKYTDVVPGNIVAYTGLFTVTVSCPALVKNALPVTSFTYTVPKFNQGYPFEIIKNYP